MILPLFDNPVNTLLAFHLSSFPSLALFVFSVGPLLLPLINSAASSIARDYQLGCGFFDIKHFSRVLNRMALSLHHFDQLHPDLA